MFECGKLARIRTGPVARRLEGRRAQACSCWEDTLKAHTRKPKVTAKSSAEAELHAAALGASEAKGVQSMIV